jgi:hypothetical protein
VTETPWESPAEDLAEQQAEVLPRGDEDDDPTLAVSDDPEVDPADAQEQAEEVPLDEDERG